MAEGIRHGVNELQRMRWGWIDENPCQGVQRNPEKPRDRYITDDEFKRVYDAASPLIQCVMDIAYLTGMRKKDILSIRLSEPPRDAIDQVFIQEDGLYVRQSKTGHKQIFEMTDDLSEVIERSKKLRRRVTGLYQFCNRKGQAYTESGFNSLWQRVRKKAGVEEFHFHDIRGKFATDLDAVGINPRKHLGHKSQLTTDNYVKARKVTRVTPLQAKFRK